MAVVSTLKAAFNDTGKTMPNYTRYKVPKVTKQIIKIESNNTLERLYFNTMPELKKGRITGIDIPDITRQQWVRFADGTVVENLTTTQLSRFQLTISKNDEAVAVVPCNVLNKGNNAGKIAGFNLPPGSNTPETWFLEQTSAENLAGRFIVVNIYYEQEQ